MQELVDSHVEGRLLACFLDLLVDLLLGLSVHLLDASGVTRPSAMKVFHGHATDFTTKGSKHEMVTHLGRVVDKQVHAGELFEGADVATLADR